MGRFSTKSGREIKETVKEDRGAARRTAAVATEGVVAGLLQHFSNIVAVGYFGHGLVAASTAIGGCIVLDTAASVVETAVNTHKYKAKIKKVDKYLNYIKTDDVDLHFPNEEERPFAKKALTKQIAGKAAFKEEYGKILRQIYNDFDTDPKFDLIREVMKEQGLTDGEIRQIQKDVKKHGYVKSSTINDITQNGKNAIGNILEIVACDEFADRIVDIDRDRTSKYKSPSHIKGCLTLTNEQQASKNVKLTKEQNFIRKKAGFGKGKFVSWLRENNALVQAGDFKALEERQNNFLAQINTGKIKSKKSINDMLVKGKKINGSIKKAAKQTPEYQITNWKRHLFPITKLLGTPIKGMINRAQEKAYYHGDLKRAHKRKISFEKSTKLKHADVYCENGTGFRKIRKQYKKHNISDFVVEHNETKAEKIPNSFVCGYIADDKYFKNTKNAAINACKLVQKPGFSKQVESKRGYKYVATCYLDDPVVITINGQNFEGKRDIPLATINVDQRQVLNATIAGILADLSKDKNFQQKVNNITFTAGGRERTIFVPQLQDDIQTLNNYNHVYSNEEEFFINLQNAIQETNCGKMVAKITRDEPFVRVYKEGILEKPTMKDDKSQEIDDNENEQMLPQLDPEKELKEESHDEHVDDANDDEVLPPEGKTDDGLSLLLLKRDLINLKKIENRRLKFADAQLELLKEFKNAQLAEENKQLEDLAREELKDKNKKLKAEIEKKLKELKEKIDLTETLVNSLAEERKNVTEFISKIEEDLNNNKIDSIAKVRTQINDYRDAIDLYYRENLQKPLVYILNEKTGKTSNLYSRLNGEQRKQYSEKVTKPRREEDAKLNDQLANVNIEIDKKIREKNNNL